MTGELRMADSIFTANLPPGFDAYLGYRDGRWPDFAAEVAKFPGAQVLDMAVTAADDATGLDVENFDATIGQAPGWTWRQHWRGAWRPVLYANASNMGALWAALQAAGITRSGVRLLCAHYTYTPHICGPATCAFPGVPACDGTQWTDRARGLNGSLIDESLLAAGFFTAAPAPATQSPREDDGMLITLTPGQRQVVPVWALASAEKLPGAYSAATLTLCGDAGAVVEVTYHWANGTTTGKEFTLARGKSVLGDPPAGLAEVAVIEVERTDKSAATVLATAVLNRW